MTKRSAFTLLELIVVITILAILGTIAFLSFQGYTSNARDSERTSDITSLAKSLELFQVNSNNYPAPDNLFTVIYSGGIVWNQGVMSTGVMTKLSASKGGISSKPVDPVTSKEYIYSTLAFGKGYQIRAELESTLSYTPQIYSPFIDTAYSATAQTYTYIKGNYNGLVARTQTGTTIYLVATPSILTSSGASGSTLDIVTLSGTIQYNNLPITSGVSFTPVQVFSGASLPVDDTGSGITNLVKTIQQVYSGSNVPTDNISSILTVSGSSTVPSGCGVLSSLGGKCGGVIVTASAGSNVSTPVTPKGTIDAPGVNCLDIMKSGVSTNGAYYIKPDSSPAFQVYCDMTTDGGGWTRVVGIKSDNLNHSQSGIVAWAGGDVRSYGKLSDSTINAILGSHDPDFAGYRFTCGPKTTYFPGSCVFDATDASTQDNPECLKYKLNYTDDFWTNAYFGDMCGITTYYATFSSKQLSGGCSGDSGASGFNVYRRRDWRGASYDSGCHGFNGQSYDGEVYVRPPYVSSPGVCGFMGGKSIEATPNTYLCKVGTPTVVTSNGMNWAWNCEGTAIANCSATIPSAGSRGTLSNPGTSCLDIKNAGVSLDGYYYIKPDSNPAFQAYCDMTTNGGGWTLVMRGKGADTTGWSTNNSLNTSNPQKVMDTFKLSDATINSIRSLSTVYRLQSDGTYNETYYLKGSCDYNHASSHSCVADCISIYSDAGFTNLVKQANACGYYQGGSNIDLCTYSDCGNGVTPNMLSGGSAFWVTGTPGAGDGNKCDGKSANCNMKMWLR